MAVIPTKAEKKVSYDVKLCQLLEDYTQILVVAADNVGSNQLENIRKDLRGDSLGAPARVGLVAPIDVAVPPGNTGLDPSQTSFFQNVLAVAVATEYSFPEADKVKEYLKVLYSAVAAPAIDSSTAPATASKEEEKKEEPAEESDDDMGFSLFD
ncbi:hypothetical protein JHK87_048848 [Glycine soja]|nr:hypothetical protein JHK87_048848 [Glycine soja]